MFKKLLILALLIPGLGGCIFTGGGGRHGHGGPPIHAHCVGCTHSFRGGIWIKG